MKKLIIAVALIAISSPAAAAQRAYDQYGRWIGGANQDSRQEGTVSRIFQQEMDRDLSGETNRRRVEEQRRQSQEDQRRFEEEAKPYKPGDVYRYNRKSTYRW